MGRRAYLTRLALGRSAYQSLAEDVIVTIEENEIASSPEASSSSYEQQYDRKGYPQNLLSEDLDRRSRRAQNDVLATIGVCVQEGQTVHGAPSGHNAISPDQSRIRSLIRENEIGLLISGFDLAFAGIATICAVGLRNRLQTFRFYSGISFLTIIRKEWRQFGSFKFLLSGAPASLAFHVLDILRAPAIRYLCNKITLLVSSPKEPREPKRSLKWLPITTEILLSVASFVLIAPLELLGTLQRLDLARTWPMLPCPSAFIPGSSASPIQTLRLPDCLDCKACLDLLTSSIVSPLFLLAVIHHTLPPVKEKLYSYIRATLPKHTRPDKSSLQATEAAVKASPSEIRGKNSSILEEIAQDLQAIGRNFQIVYDSISSLFGRKPTKQDRPARSQPLNPLDAEFDALWRVETNVSPNLHLEELARIQVVQNQIEREDAQEQHSQTITPHQSSSANLPSSTDSANDWHAFRPPFRPDISSTSPLPPSFPPSHTASRPSSPRADIQITTSASETGTLHMDLSIPITAPHHSAHFTTSTIPTRPNPTSSPKTRSGHRVTALTALAAETMAMHLSYRLADLFFWPLEALFVRSLALAFLSSPVMGVRGQMAAKWRGEILPLGAWFGARGWAGMGDYVGKMLLVGGLEVGISLGVWQVATGLAWWVGRRWFSWGRL